MCYPRRTREADDCVLALEKLLGPNTKPSLFCTDTQGALVADCRRLAFQHLLSQPGTPVTNRTYCRALERSWLRPDSPDVSGHVLPLTIA